MVDEYLYIRKLLEEMRDKRGYANDLVRIIGFLIDEIERVEAKIDKKGDRYE
jgi:uncharacterized small protein (DUF1192 family)